MIVVFGSVNIDLVTRVDRIPGPGETVLSESYSAVPGGKGANQALAAARAGAAVTFIGSCGRDAFSTLALSMLSKAHIDLSLLARVDQPTGVALITVDNKGENAIVVATGANQSTHLDQLKAASFSPGDSLLLQREIPDAATFGAIALSKAKGVRTIFNVAPGGLVPKDVLKILDILVVNEHEALIVAKGAGIDTPDLEAVVETIHRRFGCTVVVTLGPKGALGWKGGHPHRVPALSVRVVDTTAAGDSFVGAFAAALDTGLNFLQALKRGAVAGSLACTKPGAQPSIPTKAEIDRGMGA